jgi:hypothetical protein
MDMIVMPHNKKWSDPRSSGSSGRRAFRSSSTTRSARSSSTMTVTWSSPAITPTGDSLNSEAPESAAEEPRRAQTELRSGTGGPREATERPWWRKMLGG